jgi:predicted nucleic acid-binding protein
MRFWDSSAIIPLCLTEPHTEKMLRLAMADEDLVVWWATRIECHSAISRRRREGVLSGDAEQHTKSILGALADAWSEVQPGEKVRQRAERLLRVHPLRAADALQLSSALVWASESTSDQEFVCLDANLREAALKEGFTVLPK